MGHFAAPAGSGLKSAARSPLLGQGEGASPPGHATCAPWETGVPGPPRDLSQELKALPGEESRRERTERWEEEASGIEGESVTLVHRPHDAEGMAVPQSERSLSLHLEGVGFRRAG